MDEKKLYLKKQFEETIEREANWALNNNPAADTPMEGMFIQDAIYSVVGVIKQEFKSKPGLYEMSGITDEEIDQMIDETAKNILEEYLE